MIGSGRVGSSAICWLIAQGAMVSLIETDKGRAERARDLYGVTLVKDPEKAIRNSSAILNASPAKVQVT